MTTYTLRCSRCKNRASYTEKPGKELYHSADVDGWQFVESIGNVCPTCALKKVGKVMKVAQVALM